MAYVDLVSSGETLVAGGSQYNFAFDTPVSQDGSPHLTMMGVQLDLTYDGAETLTSTLSNLITSLRIKVGASEIINYDNPAIDLDANSVGNLGVIAQKVGGVDTCVQYGTHQVLGELSLPFGLDATKSHRVNVSITLGNDSTWGGGGAQTIVPATSEMNMVMYYGTAKEAVLYGSRQDFTLTNGATRTITVHGKQGWSMLGVFCMNGTTANTDNISEVRVNNGQFRQLTIQQWRNIDGTAWRSPLRYINSNAGAQNGAPQWVTAQQGNLFIDLRRLTAGAPIDMSVTADGNVTYAFAPVWVAPISQGTGSAPKQTAKQVQNTTDYVISE
jgi:hypothetical protein